MEVGTVTVFCVADPSDVATAPTSSIFAVLQLTHHVAIQLFGATLQRLIGLTKVTCHIFNESTGWHQSVGLEIPSHWSVRLRNVPWADRTLPFSACDRMHKSPA